MLFHLLAVTFSRQKKPRVLDDTEADDVWNLDGPEASTPPAAVGGSRGLLSNTTRTAAPAAVHPSHPHLAYPSVGYKPVWRRPATYTGLVSRMIQQPWGSMGRPAGMVNLGNTCYMNAVLQARSPLSGRSHSLVSWLARCCHLLSLLLLVCVTAHLPTYAHPIYPTHRHFSACVPLWTTCALRSGCCLTRPPSLPRACALPSPTA
jgi:hypothetical protein